MMTTASRFLLSLVLLFVSDGMNEMNPQAQEDYSTNNAQPAAPPPMVEKCNGIFISYEFLSRTKEYPRVKNTTAQSWAFRSVATVLNTGTDDLVGWKLFIGFQHREILVSMLGAELENTDGFPTSVGNGTYLTGYPQVDLLTSIETAGDLTQIQAEVEMTGTQFGVKPPGVPMPKTIRLENNGIKCPAPTLHKSAMYACCVKDPKHKVNTTKTKFLARETGDLIFSYDVIKAYSDNYLAQVTIENGSPLGRLDHWNLTWEWMRGEFIYTMRGAYTHKIDYGDCIYGAAAKQYSSLDFSQVMNCEKKPVITDLPRDRANDSAVGKIPYCCRNGTILPANMDPSQSKSVFQVQVYKLLPDMNTTALFPPENWEIVGALNPNYKCGTPRRVDPTEFPDKTGLQVVTLAIATWQVVCNITPPTKTSSQCCVTYSAYYNDSVIPCNTCACGCDEAKSSCNKDAKPMLLPSEALLVPFENRTVKAVAWAKINHFPIPNPLPCPDHCGVSINWHVYTDYKSGWTVRVTLFNWEEEAFENWFVAAKMKKAVLGYQKAYSFNGTVFPEMNDTIFLQGIQGMNYLIGETNGSDTKSPRVPGKQQSVIAFTKKLTPGIRVGEGDGYPTKLYFNGEECSLPSHLPTGSAITLNIINSLFLQLSLLFFLLLLINYL